MRESEIAFARPLLIDAGPLVAAINRTDANHEWAKRTLVGLRGRAITCEACLAETLHLLENAPQAVAVLRRMLGRMEVVSVAPQAGGAVLGRVATFAPEMDFADGCLVELQSRMPLSIVVTTDHRDFATYRYCHVVPH